MDKLVRAKYGLECIITGEVLCVNCPGDGQQGGFKCQKQACADALELLKEQKNLMLALDQSNSANEYLNEEVDKLNALLRQQQDEIAELTKQQNRRKHGHWIVLTDCSNAGVYCSECNTKMFDRYPMKKKFSQYCGHCGAHNDLQVEVR